MIQVHQAVKPAAPAAAAASSLPKLSFTLEALTCALFKQKYGEEDAKMWWAAFEKQDKAVMDLPKFSLSGSEVQQLSGQMMSMQGQTPFPGRAGVAIVGPAAFVAAGPTAPTFVYQDLAAQLAEGKKAYAAAAVNDDKMSAAEQELFKFSLPPSQWPDVLQPEELSRSDTDVHSTKQQGSKSGPYVSANRVQFNEALKRMCPRMKEASSHVKKTKLGTSVVNIAKWGKAGKLPKRVIDHLVVRMYQVRAKTRSTATMHIHITIVTIFSFVASVTFVAFVTFVISNTI